MLAAGQVFGEKGYHAATVEAIAQQAKIGKGTIYQYFSSKAEIFKDLHKWYLASYFESLLGVIDSEDSFADNLGRLISVHIDNVDSVSLMFKKIMTDMPRDVISGEEMLEIEAFAQENMAKVTELVGRAIDRGELRPARENTIMHFIMGMLTSTTHTIIRDQEINQGEKENLKKELTEIILYGISKENR